MTGTTTDRSALSPSRSKICVETPNILCREKDDARQTAGIDRATDSKSKNILNHVQHTLITGKSTGFSFNIFSTNNMDTQFLTEESARSPNKPLKI